MFAIDDKKLKRLESDLKHFNARALPFATKNTLNVAAFRTQKIAWSEIRNEMTLRNRFTLQSIRVEQARTLNIQRQSATIGSTADYMETQEFGGVKQKRGKHGVATPTPYAAGQGLNVKPRTRLPRKANSLQAIQLKRSRRAGQSQKQKNLIAVKQAVTSNSKVIFMDLGKRRGLFRVTGGARKPRVRMIYDMTYTAVRIPRNPWLAPSVSRVEKQVPRIYRESLQFQLKRLGLFKP